MVFVFRNVNTILHEHATMNEYGLSKVSQNYVVND